MSTLNLVDLIRLAKLPLEDLVVIRHSFNQKETKDIWNRNDTTNFEIYQSLQPSENFFKGRRYVLSFIADGKALSRFVGCYEILGVRPASEVDKSPSFPIPDMYDRPGHVCFDMKKTTCMEDLDNRLVIDWGKGTLGYVQYSPDALRNKAVVAIGPDKKHSFPGYDRVVWDFKSMKSYLEGDYEEIHTALKEVYAVYLVTDTKTGKFYIGSASGKDGLYGRWLTYAKNPNGSGTADDEDGNQGIVEYLKENPNAYLNFQYSILEIIHKAGNNEKDILATLEAEKVWKQKLCTLNTAWGLNRN